MLVVGCQVRHAACPAVFPDGVTVAKNCIVIGQLVAPGLKLARVLLWLVARMTHYF